MLSSPESDQFAPGPDDPRTPQAPSASRLTDQFPASELSPPGSQDIHNTKQQAAINEGLESVSAAFVNSRKGMEQKDGGGAEARNAPGASWSISALWNMLSIGIFP